MIKLVEIKRKTGINKTKQFIKVYGFKPFWFKLVKKFI